MAGCEWEVEGGKELLGMAIRKGLCKRKALDLCKMVQVHLERFSTNENVFSLRKRRLFLFMQGHLEKKSFLVAKKVSVFSSCKATR